MALAQAALPRDAGALRAFAIGRRVRMSKRTDLFHAWEATQKALGYSQAVRAGDTVYVAGTASLDESFNALDPGDLPAQMRNIYRRIGETLAHFSLGFGHVVRETMYVTDMDALMPALACRKSPHGDGLSRPPSPSRRSGSSRRA
ncbi:MAG: RidA family protein [Inquilinus sp.]|uniref:RidA family protein n=1 Tax=Inquilinus sp. TaxID=1932117 RepID=UPI003F3322E4